MKFIVDAVIREVLRKLEGDPLKPRFFTPKQVGKLIGCTANNVRKKCRDGALPFEKNGPKSIVIPCDEVERRLKRLAEGMGFWNF